MTEEVKRLINYREQAINCGNCIFRDVETDHERFHDHICTHNDSKWLEVSINAVCNNHQPQTDPDKIYEI